MTFRFRVTRRASAFIVIGAAMLLATTARAAIPAGPDAYCETAYLADIYATLKKTIVDGYYAHGHRGPWDDHAALGLHWWVIRVANGMHSGIANLPVKTDDEVLTELLAAEKAGCHDPMVEYALACLSLELGRDDAAAHLTAAADHVEDFEYAPLFKVNVYRRSAYGALEADAPLFWRRAEQQAVASLAKGMWSGRELMVVAREIAEEYERFPEEQKNEFGAALDPDAADPWLYGVFKGADEIRLAWASRGSGWANGVTDAGWKGFHEHIANARRALTAAHELHPDFPNAAAEMLTVCMAESDDTELQRWFDQAERAQFDFLPTYYGIAEAFMPRWGGSETALQRMGMLYADTNRYDTNGPFRIFDTAEKVVYDTGDFGGVFADKAFTAAYLRTARGYASALPTPYQKDFFAGRELATLFLTHDYAGAKRLSAGRNWSTRAKVGALGVGVILPRAVEAAELFGGAGKGDAVAAESAFAAGDFAAAISRYRKTHDTLDANSPAARLAVNRATEIQWFQALSSGKPVDVPIDESLTGLYPVWGDVTVKDGTLLCHGDEDGDLLILFGTNFGPSYQFEARFEFDKATIGDGAIGEEAAMTNLDKSEQVMSQPSAPPETANYHVSAGTIISHRGGSVLSSFVLRSLVDRDKMNFTMGGEPYYGGMTQRYPYLGGPSNHFGFVANGLPKGAEVRISQIKLIPFGQ